MTGERNAAGSFGLLGITGGVIVLQDFDLDTAPTGLTAADIGKVWKVATSVAAEDTWDTDGAAGMLARWSEQLAWQYLDPSQALGASVIMGDVLVGATSSFAGCRMGYSRAEAEWFAEGACYATVEHWTGRYTAAGSKRYAMWVDIGDLPNATTEDFAHGVTGLDMTAPNAPMTSGYFSNGGNGFTMGSTIAGGILANATVTTTNLTITSSVDLRTYSGMVRMEYCKT